MKGSYCYLAILKARGGQFNAVRGVSPTARSRFAPLFDILQPSPRQAENHKAYLDKIGDRIVASWAPDRPIYVDARDFPVETEVFGRPPAALVCELVGSHGFGIIPVTGTEIDRGADYVRKIGRLAAATGNGVCVRVEREEVEEPGAVRESLSRTLDLLGAGDEQVDLLLDLDFVGRDSSMRLQSTILEAIQAATSTASFRNIAIAGGSIPAHLGKKDTGVIRREPRVEMQAWTQVQSIIGRALAFGDFGVTNPRYVKPGKAVNVPARIRYTTYQEHLLLRTGRNGHADLCRQLVGMEEYEGASYSVGDQRMKLAAQGFAGAGSPTIWVAGDLNHHLETVSTQVWDIVVKSGTSAWYCLPEPRRYPWLQQELIES